mgnify:CR=1 FL=1
MQVNKYIKVVYSFFEELSKQHNYAILHHVERVFYIDDDIDFIVDCDKESMLAFVKEFIKTNDCFIANHFTIDRSVYRFDIVFFENTNLFKIELDCACNSKQRDLLKLNVELLLKNSLKINLGHYTFNKISNKNEIDYYIKKKAFKKTNIIEFLPYFKSLDEKITKEELLKKYTYWINYFSSFPFKIKFYYTKITLLTIRFLEKPSITIAFLGPDGSGKSTIIDKINKKSLLIINYYFHLKPIKNKNPDLQETVTNPHHQSIYSKPKSYFKLLYFIYQYNIGWLKNIIPLKIKSSLIIFDRYYDDLLVDNNRYRYGGNIKIAKLARIFIPQPDLYFVLTADPDIIYKRKQEVPFEELERQIKAYNQLSDNKCYYQIDVNRSPDEIVKEILIIMMKKKNERY